jgi:hypothetical protein
MSPLRFIGLIAFLGASLVHFVYGLFRAVLGELFAETTPVFACCWARVGRIPQILGAGPLYLASIEPSRQDLSSIGGHGANFILQPSPLSSLNGPSYAYEEVSFQYGPPFPSPDIAAAIARHLSPAGLHLPELQLTSLYRFYGMSMRAAVIKARKGGRKWLSSHCSRNPCSGLNL